MFELQVSHMPYHIIVFSMNYMWGSWYLNCQIYDYHWGIENSSYNWFHPTNIGLCEWFFIFRYIILIDFLCHSWLCFLYMYVHSIFFSESKKVTNVSTLDSSTPKVLSSKKILQKPVKTVATKVSNEITDIGFLYKNPELVKGNMFFLLPITVSCCI